MRGDRASSKKVAPKRKPSPMPAAPKFTPADEASLESHTLKRRMQKEGICGYATAVDVPGRPMHDEEDGSDDPYVADTLYMPVETSLAVHHKLILNNCFEISQKRHGRLMLFFPPGAAKSTYASVVFPSYYLGENPGSRIGLLSYGDDLARKMGRRTRAIIRQDRYRQIYDAELSKDSKAAQEFALTNGSEYMAAGLNSGITGNRFNGAIVDDPVKGREAANSETQRQKTYDIYTDDLLTRIIPGGWIIIIQTRWNEDDLSGRILPEGWNGESGDILCKDGLIWRVLCVQAECTKPGNDPLGRKMGEMLWPEWFDETHWKQFRSVPRTWSSLFQQVPTPQEGDIFKPDQIQIIDALPAEPIQWVRGWDLAATESDGAYTAGVLMGLCLNTRRIVVKHVVREQRGVHLRDMMIINTAIADGRTVRQCLPEDPAAAGKAQTLELMNKIVAGAKITPDFSPEWADKVTRALPFASQVNIGNVMMVRGPWNKAFTEELRTFDNGKYKDQVDGASRAYYKLITRPGMKISEEAVSMAAMPDGVGRFMSISDEALEIMSRE